MLGKSHLMAGVPILAAGMSIAGTLSLQGSCDLMQYFAPDLMSKTLFAPLALIGLLLPDADMKTSIIGRVIHIPVKHRTWTHCVWFLALLFFISLFLTPVRVVWLACTIHICLDAFSSSGICWFYPFQQFTYMPSGAYYRKGHNVKLYKTGQTSEYVCVVVCIIISILIISLNNQGLMYAIIY